MSQRASDGESIRQGPGKRSCKRSIDQTSGSSSSNQNSGALSDWLPGATVQTYCCSFLPFPAWKQSRDWWASGSRVPGGSCVCCLMLGTRVAKAVYYSKCGLARHGTTATFLEVVQLLQLHFPVPSQEPLLWSFSSRPWFAVVLLGLNDHMQGGVCYDSVPASAQFPRIFFLTEILAETSKPTYTDSYTQTF